MFINLQLLTLYLCVFDSFKLFSFLIKPRHRALTSKSWALTSVKNYFFCSSAFTLITVYIEIIVCAHIAHLNDILYKKIFFAMQTLQLLALYPNFIVLYV